MRLSILFLLVIVLIISSTISIVADNIVSTTPPPLTYYGESISVLKDMNLYIIPINCVGEECGGVPCLYSTLVDGLYYYIHSIMFYNYTVSRADESLVFGKEVYSKTYCSDEYGMYVTIARYDNAEFVYTSIGYFKAVYGSGNTSTVRFFGENFSNVLANLIRAMHYSSLRGLNVTVIYGGISAEIYREVAQSTCVKTDNGIACNDTVFRKEYRNPYEKYYIVVDGVRIGLPIKIRGYGGNDKRLSAQYIEGLIPCRCDEDRGWSRINVDDRLINKIKHIYYNAFPEYNNSDGELIINDIYYSITPDSMYLVPQLVISLNNTGAIAVIQLTEKGPILISKAILQGPIRPMILL